MSNKKYVTVEGSFQDGLDFADNPRLRVYRRLPTPDAKRRLGKEFVCNDFKLVGGQDPDADLLVDGLQSLQCLNGILVVRPQ